MNVRKQVRVAEARARTAATPIVMATLALELPKAAYLGRTDD